jgi:hypothetical protein
MAVKLQECISGFEVHNAPKLTAPCSFVKFIEGRREYNSTLRTFLEVRGTEAPLMRPRVPMWPFLRTRKTIYTE